MRQLRNDKVLLKRDGSEVPIESKVDNIKVEKGDRVLFVTAGSGGWGDPLERDIEKVRTDVLRGLVSRQKAADDYGVVLTETGEVDVAGSEVRRQEMRTSRGQVELFDFGNRQVAIQS